MAALPKKKISKVRGKTRRGHYKVTLPTVVIDKTTGTPRLPHRLATDTGMYNGRVALKTRMSKRLEKTLARSARASKAATKTEKPVSKKETAAPKTQTKPTAKKPSTKATEKKSGK